MYRKLSSQIIGRGARIELFEHEMACEAERRRKHEFSSLGFFVSFWAYAKKKNHYDGVSQTKNDLLNFTLH